jgi:hypothetical protein
MLEYKKEFKSHILKELEDLENNIKEDPKHYIENAVFTSIELIGILTNAIDQLDKRLEKVEAVIEKWE